ncbi:MAG: GGDEF domain-containing protein [Trueperaceae bacterium]|nr:GGDEF domain-containing protein [Trueperaceae bacterium]
MSGKAVSEVSTVDHVAALAARAAGYLTHDDPNAARETVDELLRFVQDFAGLPDQDDHEAPRAIFTAPPLSNRAPPRVDVKQLDERTAQSVVEGALTGLRAAFLSGDADAAVPLGQFALELAGEYGLVKLAARAHNELAAVYGSRDFNDRAMHHLRSAMELLEQHGEGVSPSQLNNLGNVYMAGERLDEALACYLRARQTYADQGDAFGDAIATSNVGRVMVRLGNPADGIAMLEDALDAFEGLGRRAYVGATLGKMGVAYAGLGDHERAERNFLRALASFSSEDIVPFRMEVNQGYGRFLLAAGQAEEALAQFEAGEATARGSGVKAQVAAFLRLKASTLSALGRFQEAYSALHEHIEVKEQLDQQRGRDVVGLLLLEMQTRLPNEHELSVLTSQILADTNRSLRDQASKLERLSVTDDLTGLANRRFLNGRLNEEVTDALRRGRDVSLILVDLDGFKQINDSHSHLIGDEVLQRLGGLLRTSVRRTDVVARWGGEEFAILLPGAGKATARAVAEQVRAAVAQAEWGDIALGISATVSAGVASLSDLVVSGWSTGTSDAGDVSYTWLDGDVVLGSEGEPLQELLKLADRRLYLAKQGGRNRIES